MPADTKKQTFIEPVKPWLMHRLSFTANTYAVRGTRDEDGMLDECKKIHEEFNKLRDSETSRSGLWRCLKATVAFDYMGASEFEWQKPQKAFDRFLDCTDHVMFPLEVTCKDQHNKEYVETFYIFGPRSTVHTQVYAVLKSLWFHISPVGRCHLADFRCKARNGIGESSSSAFYQQGFFTSKFDRYEESTSTCIGTFDLDNSCFVFWDWFVGGCVYRLMCGEGAKQGRKHSVDISGDLGAYSKLENIHKLVLETLAY